MLLNIWTCYIWDIHWLSSYIGICNLYQYLLMRKIWWKMPWSVYSSIIIKVCIMNMRKKKNTYTYNLIKSVLRIRLLDMYVLRKSHLFYISIHTLITWFDLVFILPNYYYTYWWSWSCTHIKNTTDGDYEWIVKYKFWPVY